MSEVLTIEQPRIVKHQEVLVDLLLDDILGELAMQLTLEEKHVEPSVQTKAEPSVNTETVKVGGACMANNFLDSPKSLSLLPSPSKRSTRWTS